MAITVLKNNVPWGPFTRSQVDEGLARGDFTVETLAHAPGLGEWVPLRAVLEHVDRSWKLPPVPSPVALPSIPKTEGDSSWSRPPAPPPATTPTVPKPPPLLPPKWPEPPPVPVAGVKPEPAKIEPRFVPVMEKPEPVLRPAAFVPRAFAFLIDSALLFVPIVALFALGSLTIVLQGWWQHTNGESLHEERELLWQTSVQLFLVVAIGLGWLYAAWYESGRGQATIGKRWLGLKVTDRHGERISFLRATGRHGAKYLSALPCFLGFMAALFSSRNLALHDRMAGTRVVRD